MRIGGAILSNLHLLFFSPSAPVAHEQMLQESHHMVQEAIRAQDVFVNGMRQTGIHNFPNFIDQGVKNVLGPDFQESDLKKVYAYQEELLNYYLGQYDFLKTEKVEGAKVSPKVVRQAKEIVGKQLDATMYLEDAYIASLQDRMRKLLGVPYTGPGSAKPETLREMVREIDAISVTRRKRLNNRDSVDRMIGSMQKYLSRKEITQKLGVMIQNEGAYLEHMRLQLKPGNPILKKQEEAVEYLKLWKELMK